MLRKLTLFSKKIKQGLARIWHYLYVYFY